MRTNVAQCHVTTIRAALFRSTTTSQRTNSKRLFLWHKNILKMELLQWIMNDEWITKLCIHIKGRSSTLKNIYWTIFRRMASMSSAMWKHTFPEHQTYVWRLRYVSCASGIRCNYLCVRATTTVCIFLSVDSRCGTEIDRFIWRYWINCARYTC